jgi:DNA-binding transcriptional LysR family regulator
MTGIDLDGLRSFLAVAELGSFHQAASGLAVSQSALSRRIQKLEEALGAPLLERTTRRVRLSRAGQAFLPRARRMLDEFEESLRAVRDAAAPQAGRVTIACLPSVTYYLLPGVLARFHRLFPEVRVRIIDDGASAVLQRVRDGRAEVGVSFLGRHEEEIAFAPMGEDPFVLACRHDHPLASREIVRWAELAAYPFIAGGPTSGNRLLIESALAAVPWRLHPFYEMQHLPSALGLVEAGLGIAALPLLSLPPASHPVLTYRRLIEPEIHRSLGVIRRRGSGLSRPARDLLRLLAAAVRSPLAR